MQTVTFGFDEIFKLGSDNVPTLKRTLVVADILLTPGMHWRRGFKFAGWDIANYMGQPLVVIDKGDHLLFSGFAALDQRNPGWAKGWVVSNNDSPFLFGFYPTEYLANEALKEAGESYVASPGSKRFGENDEFIAIGGQIKEPPRAKAKLTPLPMTPTLKVPALPFPASRPHTDAMKSFGGGAHSYDPDFWEFEYQTFQYLGRVSDKELRDRHREIARNMSALTTSDRDVIPIESFLSSWYWFRKEHQTRLEFFLRGVSITAPCLAKASSAKLNGAPYRPRHPNAGDVLFRYGQKQFLEPMQKEGILRVFRASKQREAPADEARFDDECAKTRYMPGQYTEITAPNGKPIPVDGDVSRRVLGPDYYMLCMSCDWDVALFDDFSKSDSCLIVTDAEKFVRRLEAAMQTILPAPAWCFNHNPVEYFDPYEQVPNAYFDSSGCKDFRFAYQREYRFLWFPLGEECVDKFKDVPALGSLEDVTKLYPRPETKT